MQVQYLAGRYRLVEQLGTGGMSVVWRAYDDVLGRPVAVKVLAPQLAADARSRARIRAEAQSAGRLSHPHITAVHDFGESRIDRGPTVPFVVMELVDGKPLDVLLARGPLPWRTAAEICAQTASALAAAHARGLVHRDVKPANVMLTATGAKLVDFGVSALAGDCSDGQDGQLLGTPAYLAPERLDGAPTTPATDVYALGLVLYKAITGELPWRTESTAEMLRAHCFLPPAPLPTGLDVPASVRNICLSCLAKSPDQRPTAVDLARTLAVAAGLWVNALDPPSAPVVPDPVWWSPTPVAAVDTPTLSTPARRAVPPRDRPVTTAARLIGSRRARLFSLGSGIAVVVVVASVVAWSWVASARVVPSAARAATLGPPTLVADQTAPCEVRYAVSSDTGAQFAVDVRLTNTGPATLPDWTLRFAFPAAQRVVQGVGGAWTQAGAQVTVVHPVDPTSLPAGGTATLAFTGAYAGDNLLPTAFTVNDLPCRLLLAGAPQTKSTRD